MQNRIFKLLVEEDEITWQSLIHDLVKTEQMDPWDINISLLSQRFLETLKKLKKMDFRVSGKVVLAAAILLRMKSYRLVGQDLTDFDRMIVGQEQLEEEFYDELEQSNEVILEEKHTLVPKTPQPRKRKVSVYDLVNALEKALEVKRRRRHHIVPTTEVNVPEKKIEITEVIKKIYVQIKNFFTVNKGKKLTFNQLIPSVDKEDKVLTFIPLLHLASERKVDLLQEKHFGEIEIKLK